MTSAYANLADLTDVAKGERPSARRENAQTRAIRLLVSANSDRLNVSGGIVSFVGDTADRSTYAMIQLDAVDPVLGEPFYGWSEVRIRYNSGTTEYEVETIAGGRTSAAHGPAYVSGGGKPAGAVYARRFTAVNGQPMWWVGGSTPFLRGSITAVNGFDGDNAGTVTYDAESDDGAVTITGGTPVFRPYGPEVPVSIALIGDVCLIDPGGTAPTIAISTEKILTETCDGAAAYAWESGAGNGLDEDLLVIAPDGTPVVTDDGRLVVVGTATPSQSAAYDRIVVTESGEIVFDANGSPVVSDPDDDGYVSPAAFDFLVMADDTTLLVANSEAVISPQETPGVAIEAEPTSVQSLIAQSQGAGSPTPIYLEAGGGVALSANWDAGNFEIRSATFESDVSTGTAPLTIASTTLVSNLNADLLDGYHASSFGLASVGSAFPTSGLVSGRSTCFRTDLCELFTYLGASDSPTGAAAWVGQPFAVGFGTTAVTSTTGSQAFIAEGNVLTDQVDRGKAFSFDCVAVSLDATNGDAAAISGTLTIYKNSSTLTSQTWSSEANKGSTPLVKLTAGEVLGCDFNLTSGTLTRMTVTLRLARIIAA